ncbi:MAG TPA: acetyl-CoA hydrolase/transferase C-terminal domain-containing protein [Caulobacteraceae bacterium]
MTSAADRVLAELKPGLSIYIQGATGEPLALREIVAAAPDALAGRRLTGCFLPGINDFDYAALNPDVSLATFLLPPAMRASFEAGRVAVHPLPYSQIAAWFADGAAPDLAVLQVAPPNAQGLCSLGPCADFAPLVWPRARRKLAFINRQWPRARWGPSIPLAAIDTIIETDGPFITGAEAAPTPAHLAIAAHVADLIEDGASIQSGIGAAPAAIVAALTSRKRLVIRSGMVTEGYRALAAAGALAGDAAHVTGLAFGSEAFMRWAAENLTFADARVTHGAASLARTARLVAINSALEVDLFGQGNIEWRSGRLVSGLGGAPDFARAARHCVGGRAILALPATASGGKVSRIVARLSSPTVSIPRDDTDLVATEHGVADLRATDLDVRAHALIAIAAPEHRGRLADEWTAMRRNL